MEAYEGNDHEELAIAISNSIPLCCCSTFRLGLVGGRTYP